MDGIVNTKNRSGNIGDVEIYLDKVRHMVQQRIPPDSAEVYLGIATLIESAVILLENVEQDEGSKHTLRKLRAFLMTHDGETLERIKSRFSMREPSRSTLGELLVCVDDVPNLIPRSHTDFTFSEGDFTNDQDDLFRNHRLLLELLSHDVIFAGWNPLLLVRVQKCTIVRPEEDIWLQGDMQWKTVAAILRPADNLVAGSFERNVSRPVLIRCQRMPAARGGYHYTASVYEPKKDE